MINLLATIALTACLFIWLAGLVTYHRTFSTKYVALADVLAFALWNLFLYLCVAQVNFAHRDEPPTEYIIVFDLPQTE